MLEVNTFLQANLPMMTRHYIRCLNKDLALHNVEKLFARNVLIVLQQQLESAKTELPAVSDSEAELKLALAEQTESFIQAALTHNRSSCAMSNFPDDYNPSPIYIGEVLDQCNRLLDRFVQELKRG